MHYQKAPLIAGRMAGHHPLNRYAVTGGALRRFLVGVPVGVGLMYIIMYFHNMANL